MIDVHCHILPGVDDGPRGAGESVALAEALIEDGVHTVVATPHVRGYAPSAQAHEIAERCTELRSAFDDLGLPLDVVPGAELELFWALEASAEQLQDASYGQLGRILLVETPYGELPPAFEDLLYRLGLRGYTLLLAHPERSPTFQRHPERLAELVRRGVGAQITARSLVSDSSSDSATLATWLVRRRLVTAVASDAHGASGRRRPALSSALERVEKVSPGLSQWLGSAVPEAIVKGRNVPAAPYAHSERAARGWVRALVPRHG